MGLRSVQEGGLLASMKREERLASEHAAQAISHRVQRQPTHQSWDGAERGVPTHGGLEDAVSAAHREHRAHRARRVEGHRGMALPAARMLHPCHAFVGCSTII